MATAASFRCGEMTDLVRDPLGEVGVCRVALNKNAVVGTVFRTRCPGEKDSQIERRFGRLQAGLPHLLQDIAPLNGW